MFHWTCSVNPQDSRNFSLDSRKSHWTCPVYRTCPVWDQSPETPVGLQRPPTDLSGPWPASRIFSPDSGEVHWTCPMKDSPMALFEMGAINRLPPALRPLPTHKKQKTLLRFSSWALSSLPKLHSWILFLREDLSSLGCATFKQEHLILSLMTSLHLLLLGIEPPRRLGLPGSSQGLWWGPGMFVLPSSSWGLIVRTKLVFVTSWED
jgi:hypothetical protein